MAALSTKAAAMIAAGIGLYWALEQLSGAWVWLLVTVASISFIGAILLVSGAMIPSIRHWRGVAINSLVALTTTGLIFTGLELALLLYESIDHQVPIKTDYIEQKPSADALKPSGAWIEPDINLEVRRIIAERGRPLTMPEDWRQRRVDIPGAAKAYYWHGVLHVRDENRFRRTTPFPDKKAGTFRIMIVGDSLTYGVGIDERWTYPAVLERRLRNEFNIEVLNLGIVGWNSEDIFRVLETWVPKLDPDLVIYGVCLNDFLPSNVEQEVYDDAYALPLPRWVHSLFTQKTRLGAFLSDRYDTLLRKWDLRKDFFDGILADIEGHQTRFANDVAGMNAFVGSRGLPAIIGMVLHQQPRYQGRGHRLTRIAEDAMRRAGFTLVPTEDYFRRYNNRNLAVGRWEGHPNETANQIFAAMLEVQLRPQLELGPYRTAPVEGDAAPKRD
jgi:lysophospholipase L1-like esterase